MFKEIQELKIDPNTKMIIEEKSMLLEDMQELAICSKAIKVKPQQGRISVSGHEVATDTYHSIDKKLKRYFENITTSAELFEDVAKKEYLYNNAIIKTKKKFAEDVYNEFLKDVLLEKEITPVEGQDELATMRKLVKNNYKGVYIVSTECFERYAGTKFKYSDYYNEHHYQGFKVIQDEYLTEYDAIFVVLEAVHIADEITNIELFRVANADSYDIYARLKQAVSIENDYIASLKNAWIEKTTWRSPKDS